MFSSFGSMKVRMNSVYQQTRRFFFKKHNLGKCSLIQNLGKVSDERLTVPDHIDKPAYYEISNSNNPSSTSGEIEIKNAEQIAGMRQACNLAANILKKCGDVVKVGMTTDEIDSFVYHEAIANNAYPSPLRYRGFPKSVCTSVNNIACHGIPDDRKLEDGDFINIDITVYLNKFHGDTSKTFLIGNVDDRGRYLVHHNEISLQEAIKVCRPGQPFHAIGGAISKYAKECDLRIVPAFIGHGIGSFFHGPPEIYHFENDFDIGTMQPGMTFTIEPILSLGSEELVLWEDGWTTTTIDGSRTSQCEHTILITDDGCEVLTVPD